MRAFSWQEMWIPTWPPWEVALRALLLYTFLVVLLRLSGRKEMTRYSNFDVAVLFLITVASRTVILGDDHSLTNAFVALTTIVGANSLLSYVTFRSKGVGRVVEGAREVLVEDGRIDAEALRRSRITHDGLLARLRHHGHEDLSRVKRAYLEHNGQVTFVMREE